MLQARFTNTKLKDEEIKTYANDISITPLSIPMLCGPGAIANGIMLMDDANTWTMKGVLIGMIGLIYFITYLILRASTRLVSILGETGNNVMMRLMGLILMVIAVECFVSGLRPILIDIINQVGFNQRKNVLKVEYDYLIHFEHILCIWVLVISQIQLIYGILFRGLSPTLP